MSSKSDSGRRLMESVNGRVYPLWGQFVDRKEEFIGGILEETQDSHPQVPGEAGQTKIVDITLKPNGESGAFFSIEGENYGCGFDVECGGITAGEEGWLTFSGYGGHEFRIQKPADFDVAGGRDGGVPN